MTEKPDPRTPRGALRALTNWLKRPVPPPGRDAAAVATPYPGGLPPRIGRYVVTGKLGQGGMGVVYAAHDDRLDRRVAVKTLSAVDPDETARKRFWREARLAAGISHPHICQLYEIGEEGSVLFIAMELLDGEPLSERLRRGPASVADTVATGAQILSALAALHARGVIHRDLKPSNVFLTPHGVKLLDFGLARTAGPPSGESSWSSWASEPALTGTGMVVGTPRYMSPEQALGERPVPQSDLFAVGAILFEMLAGRPAFNGRNAVEVLHATLNEQPPALVGSPAVAAADRVVRRALAKRPADRYPSAEAMAEALQALPADGSGDARAVAQALTRIVVLPFRVLRADPETDFLAYSLPDAIATSLKAMPSLVVRSSAAAARFAGEAPDLKAVASEVDVDRVVVGTLLRAGDQLRATAQLVDAPVGTLVTSLTVQSSLGDLFRLQDDIAQRVAEALALPLGGEALPTPDAPHDPTAYRLFLRANDLARRYDQMPEARDLYRECLDRDPGFAPAWAQLGRAQWVIAKFIGDPDGDAAEKAERAFRRALAANPRLSLAHKLYAQFESDTGRALQALERLLDEAARHGNDPELFAGLVHACRYCGLFEESLLAHREARRLDPHVPTSHAQTLLMMGDLEGLSAAEPPAPHATGDQGIRVIGLGLAGRLEEANVLLAAMKGSVRIPAFEVWTAHLQAWLDRRVDDMGRSLARIAQYRVMGDPEAIFQVGRLLCDVGDHQRGLAEIERAVDLGYFVADTLARTREFEAVRDRDDFRALLARAETGRANARRLFEDRGGRRLLGG